jgi:type IV pilus assembly protein PilY1
VNADASCPANTQWSGNFLNWLTMTNLDQFRSVLTGGTRDNFSSMNGTHAGDTTARTVLIRSFSDRNSYNPTKRIRTTTPGVPVAQRGSDKFVRSGGYGSKFVVSNANNFADWSAANQRNSCSNSPLPGGAGTSWCFNIRVEACVASPALGVTGNALEANCVTKYSGVPKPEGLVQQYANTLRFGAFGYLNDSSNDRSGGVLRAAMKSVGPYEATANGIVANTTSSATKTNMEWNTATGVIFANPDTIDSAASGVANSGLINYLNKFGYATGYKGFDPVSELVYAAQLYLRGETPPAAYSNNLNAALVDDFPVITGNALRTGNARDPIINSCQKNFMLAIGDIYTHCDGNLPGSTNAGCPGGTPADPAGLNVQNLWNTVRGLEGMPDARDSTGINGWAGGAGTPTPYVAGLTYWANTNDIRPGNGATTKGTQTISTYFVDVLENGNGVGGWPAAGLLRSQYWLAAKYGGFKNKTAYPDDPLSVSGTNPNTDSTSWDANGDGVPDTWFAGSTPELLKSGLSSAFGSIAAAAGSNSASSAAVTSSRQTSNSQILYAGYNASNWSGTVSACSTTQTAAQCSGSPTWEASVWFNTKTATFKTTQLTDTNRKIFTSSLPGGAFSSMPFEWASLNATQRAVLNSTDGLGSSRLDYLRGNRAAEGTVFRTRSANLLGDIVNSGVTYLAGSGPAFSGPNYPGHAAYRTSNKSRPPVVYVGGNDGMLHAFSGDNGKELFGYIPGLVFANLPSLSALNFQHQYFVDSTPMVGDFQKNAATWGTMLVGALGAGGKGYYALDITSQATFATSTQATLSALPLWEFSSAQDADMGFSFNEASINPLTGAYQQIAKVADAAVADGVWRVVIGNGYGSTAGRAALFLINANTGAATNKLVASNGPSNGLSSPTPVDTDRDGLIDTVYAGDALGNMHKFQFSIASGSDFVLSKPGLNNGAMWRYIGVVFASGEPITTAPSVAPSCDGVGWNVAFGSGKFNEDADYTNTNRRGFYTVVDKGASSSLTVSSNDLATITYTTSQFGTDTVGRSWIQPNLAGKRGWQMFFTGGERVLSNSTLPPDTGAVLFATTKPAGDVCTPGNTGFLMAVNLCSGRSGDLIANGLTVGGLAIESTGIVKVSNTYTNRSNKQVVVCNQDGCKGPGAPTLNQSIAPRGRYNWREILTK